MIDTQNDQLNSIPDGSQPDSQANDAQDDGQNPAGSDIADQLTPEQIKSLQEENGRLKGQVSAVQRKYQSTIRNGMNRQPVGGEGQDSDPNMQTFELATEIAEAKLRNELETNIFPLYDGTNPEFEGQGSLPAQELMRIRQNPWAFASRQSLFHALKTGDLEPAKLDIEQAIADRVEASSAPTKPTKIPKSVNPNPAPQAAPKNQTPNGQDPWTMPLDQLEQLSKNAAATLSQK